MTDDNKPTNKISARPPAPKPTLDEWIEQGGKVPIPAAAPIESAAFAYPWENPSLRNDVKKDILLPLREPYMAKLNYISEHRKRLGLGRNAKQAIVIEIVEKALDDMLRDII